MLIITLKYPSYEKVKDINQDYFHNTEKADMPVLINKLQGILGQ